MPDTYRTISSASEAVFTEKRSKFLAFAFPVDSIEQAKIHVDTLSKKYFDARHVCWAYMLGPERLVFRSNDNGEPSGTAGKPILGQINSFELTDILVAVVRYFGGIKLGTSGLIAAYRQAARMAIEAAETIECHVTSDVVFNFPYIAMNDVMKVTKEPGVEMIDSTFDNSCSMKLRIDIGRIEAILSRLNKIDGITFVNERN